MLALILKQSVELCICKAGHIYGNTFIIKYSLVDYSFWHCWMYEFSIVFFSLLSLTFYQLFLYFFLLRIRFRGRSNMRWPLCPWSASPQWPCSLLKLEDTANCTTMLTSLRWVSWSCPHAALSFSVVLLSLCIWSTESSWSHGLCASRLARTVPEYDLLPVLHWHVYLLDSSVPAS